MSTENNITENNITETETEPVIDLFALFAEVEAELATPEGAALAAARAYVPPPAPPSPTNRGNCGRCAGLGTIGAFYYIAGGVCFACNGRGSR